MNYEREHPSNRVNQKGFKEPKGISKSVNRNRDNTMLIEGKKDKQLAGK